MKVYVPLPKAYCCLREQPMPVGCSSGRPSRGKTSCSIFAFEFECITGVFLIQEYTISTRNLQHNYWNITWTYVTFLIEMQDMLKFNPRSILRIWCWWRSETIAKWAVYDIIQSWPARFTSHIQILNAYIFRCIETLTYTIEPLSYPLLKTSRSL